MGSTSKKGLKGRLLTSVFSVVTITMVLILVFGLSLEQNRLQKTEIDRIFYETDALSKRLGQMVYNSNLRSGMIALTNSMQSDPSMLFFTVTDPNNHVLISDRVSLSEDFPEDRVTILNQDPVFTQTLNTGRISKRFSVYLSVLNQDILMGDQLRGKDQERVFDTIWDIVYMDKKVGSLRIGFSRKHLRDTLLFYFWMMLASGILIMAVTMLMIFLVIKRSLLPFERLMADLAGLKDIGHEGSLKKQLDKMSWEENDENLLEAVRLKAALQRIKELFSRNLAQLEAHQDNLEQMVDERTTELNAINIRLKNHLAERKEIETRLVNAQKLESIGTLAGGIAHEFNNLFMAIAGYAALIQRRSEPGHPNHDKAEKIRDLVANGSESIKQLLGFARSGKYSPMALNLNEVIKANMMVMKHSRKDMEIDTRLESKISSVYADRAQMNHVIMNLFLNASEAMPGGGTLTIETRNVEIKNRQIGIEKAVSGPFVMFSFKDSGHGMAQDVVERVFDPFFTTKEMGVGTGMGLASVYGIIDNHKGFITAESTPGSGSEFCVFLPAISHE
ncbi:MAG: hypothetical protein D3926_23705 [Desulfobacteraceae bacterium]|nr:MAG: hypothetical protein D3926_23705 [Desulfobacteraceae bacterium]